MPSSFTGTGMFSNVDGWRYRRIREPAPSQATRSQPVAVVPSSNLTVTLSVLSTTSSDRLDHFWHKFVSFLY